MMFVVYENKFSHVKSDNYDTKFSSMVSQVIFLLLLNLKDEMTLI